MRVEDIKVGETYAGRKGKPRTVVSMGVRLSGRVAFGNVIYHSGNADVRRECWQGTFAGWVRTVTPPDSRDALIAEARRLLKGYQEDWLYDCRGCTADLEVRAWLAATAAHGKEQK